MHKSYDLFDSLLCSYCKMVSFKNVDNNFQQVIKTSFSNSLSQPTTKSEYFNLGIQKSYLNLNIFHTVELTNVLGCG